MGKSAGSPPPAPDYKGAAEATAASQRVNQYTPYGSQIWSQGPSSQVQTGSFRGTPIYGEQPGQWSSTTTLNPDAQHALNSQMQLSAGLGDLSQQQLGAVNAKYSQPMGSQSVQDVSDKAYGAMTSRLDPQWDARATQNETRLVNQGLRPGGEAYTNASRDFNNARNDAYQQANLASIQTMPQTYQLESSLYNQPLNTLNAIRSGAQINNPQFGNNFPGTNYGAATQQQGNYAQGLYNADIANQNANTQGATGLASAAMLAYALSDRRLKRDIEKLGDDPRGFGIYRFRYLWSDDVHIGVMADEVERILPHAVKDFSGFKAVNYGAL